MISLTTVQAQNPFLFVQFFQRLEEGGMFFMFPILIMLLLVFFLIVRGVLAIRKNNNNLQKHIKLLNSIGLLTLVWGMLGQLIGIVGMFDQLEAIGNISTTIFAGGLKVSALPPIFGFIVFIISRIASIVFTWIDKEA
ncbi:MotA/TolQ/ExbB proton channel family protein [Aquimarina sp. 2201CG14-23]|uniref:MotA/TolQ/ExbB proton channel family protein n=1 Tax=Aquimarina mycalae TaxID=3040073 RepID=UPI002477CC37|nr:MotA/TolQ/ExbB proton channel family protein [Aquimarina sp. 2201CG14-23]MDH7445936.1 MotA/TolQ/ExbB proton channel family protein [Aquimarina sp. 2201CG14-23]